MDTLKKFERREASNGLKASDISDDVAIFTEKLMRHDVFSGLGSDLYDLLKVYDITEAIHHINDALTHQVGPRRQIDNQITEIPPEGIIIDQPGTYTFASSSALTWSPDMDAGAAITIVSNNVILDLKQNNLSADVQDSSKHLVGIFVFGASNVTIQNGALVNMCLYGIQAELVENLTIENINVSGLEYKNTNIRQASPNGIQVNFAKQVNISNCQFQYFYVSADNCSGVQLMNTLGGVVENCTASHLYNYAGAVMGFGYFKSSGIKTQNCHSQSLESHFGLNIRTAGHTVLGFLQVLCDDLQITQCSAKEIIGSCDDSHGMSVFLNANVTVDGFHVDGVTDGVTQFNSGAKATGLEVYGVDVQVSNCTVNNIRAINPQDRVSTGFSVWGADISLSCCTASNVSVSNDLKEQPVLMGTGTGFGWAPDPRLYSIGAFGVTYQDCKAVNCQVGFDTWNHIDGEWTGLTHQNCAINILVEPGGTRTLYGDPCTECNPPVSITVHNQAKNNVYPGAPQNKPAIYYPYPTGNINGLSMPYALSRLSDVTSQWWFYVGLLKDDQDKDHSFELTFIEPGGVLGDVGLTAVDFDFSFTSNGNCFHATSTYGGDEPLNMLQSVINTIGFGTVTSDDKAYSISVDSLSGAKVQVDYDAGNSLSSDSMFTGKIGQPGAAYVIEGQGDTWLWQYPTSGKGMSALYQYSLKIEVIDERGVVAEGLGSYVGVDPIHPPSIATNSSVEYAQPRLRVVNWEITLTRNTECWPLSSLESLEGFDDSFCFKNNRQHSNEIDDLGHLWLDRQALFKAASYQPDHGKSILSNILAEAHKTLGSQQIKSAFDDVKQGRKSPQLANDIHQIASNLTSTSPDSNRQQLYVGCWLPIVLSKGPYAGSTLMFAAFWKQARRIANYDTDKGDAKPDSFMNLYTGLLGNNAFDVHSAYTLSDLLNPSATVSAEPSVENNFRVQFTEQFERIGDLANPQRWASEMKVTVKAFSQARYALSAYAKRAGREEAIGPDEDLTFTIKAVSDYTYTTTISSSMAPIYEGASRIYMEDGTEVGSGWIEQMVGAPAS